MDGNNMEYYFNNFYRMVDVFNNRIYYAHDEVI